MTVTNPHLIFDNIDSGIILLDDNLNVLYWNRWLEIRTKIKKEEIADKSLASLFPYINEKKLKRKIKTTLVLGSPTFYSVEQHNYFIKIPLHNITTKLHNYMQQNITIAPYDKEKKHVCIYIYDETLLSDTNLKLHKTLDTVRSYNKTLQNIMDTNKQMLVISDGVNITFANNAFMEFLKISDIPDFFTEHNQLSDIFISTQENPYDVAACDGLECVNYLLSLEVTDRVVSILDKSTNSQQIFLIDITSIKSEKNSYLWNFTNITKIAMDNQALTYSVFHDPLTKVFNRVKLEERLTQELQQYARYQQTFCLVIIDIDHFKDFNDSYGHLIGDEMLILFAQTINKYIRGTDLFARWGGEEFGILFSNTDTDATKKAIENIQTLIQSIVHKTAGSITASFGITKVKENDTNDTMFERADRALYLAKSKGRDRYEVGK